LDARDTANVVRHYYIDFDPTISGWQYVLKDIPLDLDGELDIDLYCEYQGMGMSI
jgi:hypothetical protein